MIPSIGHPLSSYADRPDAAAVLKHDALSPKKRKKMEKIIHSFQWQDKLLSQHVTALPRYETFLKFLYDSRLIFTIRGYETSLQPNSSEMREGIKMINGEPHILIENVWTKWNEVLDQFHCEHEVGITDKDHHVWNYLYPNGLTQKDRYNLVDRVHQLSKKELDHLYQVGQKFYVDQPEKCPEQHNCSYLQVFTTDDAVSDRVLGHIGVRLIDREGNLYSFGFERPRKEALKSALFTAFATYNVGISSLDFKEFTRFKERRVTTIPLNAETFDKVLHKIQGYAASPLRFNFIHQNCVTFAADTLREAGVPLETKTHASHVYFFGVAPRFLRKIIKAVDQFFSTCPQWVKVTLQVISFPFKIITFIPSLFFTLIQNLFNLTFGARRQGAPMQEGAENELDNSKRLTSFKHLYNHWTDVFKVQQGDAPYLIADWQRDQLCTETFAYAGPQFYLAQSEPDAQIDTRPLA